METFSALLTLCEGNSPATVDSTVPYTDTGSLRPPVNSSALCPFRGGQCESATGPLADCRGLVLVRSKKTTKLRVTAVTRSFVVFFDLRLNKRLSKQWRRWWSETPFRSLWRHCNAIVKSDLGKTGIPAVQRSHWLDMEYTLKGWSRSRSLRGSV